ncbi:hypothetical protein M011DRAFT_415565, partial [Sporormia fimetaria CBS 119925]
MTAQGHSETHVDTRDCSVCGTNLPLDQFPALSDCHHQPEICAACFSGWIRSQLDTVAWDRIKCPGTDCQVFLRHEHVKQHAEPKVFRRYDALSLVAALSGEPNFRRCQRPGCQSGQIHDGDADGNIFTCVSCGFRMCVRHGTEFHEGETCEEYDERIDLDGSRRRAEEFLSKTAKRCPGPKCGWFIEKVSGCDHMICSRCGHEFCWECLAPYRGPNGVLQLGTQAHTKTC